MTTQVEFQPTSPPLRFDEAGGIRVGQSRVTLDSLLAAYHNGATPEEIAVQYSVLDLAEIYAAITYYLTHRQQVDRYLEQRHQAAQKLRHQEHSLVGLRQRLLTRQQSQMDNR